MARRCIVNVSVEGMHNGAGNCRPYVTKGLKRLRESLAQYPGVQSLTWVDSWPMDSPTEAEMPRAFKVYAMERAAKENDVLLWVDSSMWFVRDPSPVFEWIEEHGFYGLDWGHPVGDKLSDEAVERLESSRLEVGMTPLVLGGFWGVDVRSEVGRQLMAYMGRKARDGSFAGTNGRDEGPLSLAVRRMGLVADRVPGLVTPHNGDKSRAVALFCGL
jgi:hypothetical protein